MKIRNYAYALIRWDDLHRSKCVPLLIMEYPDDWTTFAMQKPIQLRGQLTTRKAEIRLILTRVKYSPHDSRRLKRTSCKILPRNEETDQITKRVMLLVNMCHTTR